VQGHDRRRDYYAGELVSILSYSSPQSWHPKAVYRETALGSWESVQNAVSLQPEAPASYCSAYGDTTHVGMNARGMGGAPAELRRDEVARCRQRCERVAAGASDPDGQSGAQVGRRPLLSRRSSVKQPFVLVDEGRMRDARE
jgi:hypothetical protein